jgi:hypothetical protein
VITASIEYAFEERHRRSFNLRLRLDHFLRLLGSLDIAFFFLLQQVQTVLFLFNLYIEVLIVNLIC